MILYLVLFIFLVLGQAARLEFYQVALMGLDFAVFLLLIKSLLNFSSFIKTLKTSTMSRPLFVFLLISVFALGANSFSFTIGQNVIAWLYLLRFMLYVSFFYVMRQGLTQKKITRKLIKYGLIMVGTFLALAGFLQLFLYPDIRNLFYLGWDPHFGRLVSTTFDPNFAGIILVISLLLIINKLSALLGHREESTDAPGDVAIYIKKIATLFSLARNDKKNNSFRISTETDQTASVLLFLFFINFLALVLTFSRSSYLALVTGSLIYGILQKKLKYFFLITTFLIVAVFLVSKPVGEGGKLGRTSTASARVANWQEGLALWQKSPIYGFGFNTLPFVKIKYGLLPDKQNGIPNHSAAGADSSLLFVLLTTGIVGLGSFLWLMWKIFRIVAKEKILLPIFAAVFLHSLFQNTLFFPQVLILLLLLMGVADAGGKSSLGENT